MENKIIIIDKIIDVVVDIECIINEHGSYISDVSLTARLNELINTRDSLIDSLKDE